MYKYYNPNPFGSNTADDCAVRAVTKALGTDWDNAYAKLVVTGFRLGKMPSSDVVWGSVLRQNGFVKETLPNTCPDCYTAEQFCIDHPKGTYVLKFTNHAACVIDGNLYDSWNSLHEVPFYYWRKV